MRPLFADTFYWIALLNRREAWYSRVVALSRTLGTQQVLTTEWVLAEFLAFYSVGGAVTRQRAAARTRQMLQDPQIHVLPPSQATFLDGLTLYEARLDKHYSLTDCISMHVMRREGLTNVLTNDHHFTQEGFHNFLREAHPLRGWEG
jgi:predicted nucleic acid-binding protein